MGWTFVWMMVALKIPIAALLYIVWWAIKQSDEQPATGDEDGGVRPPHRPHPPRHPRRRGPHDDPALPPPAPRTRIAATARSRPLTPPS